MNLIIGILGTIVIVYIWIWIIDNAFKNKQVKWNISLQIFILSLFLVIFLYFYKDVLVFFGLEDFYLLANNSRKNTGSFVLYSIFFVILLSLSFGNISKNKSLQFIVVSLLLFCAISIGGSIMGINVIVMYYIVSSYAEEILKFSVGQNVFLEEREVDNIDINNTANQKLAGSDLIFFAIMAGLGFSIIENVFYMVTNYVSGEISVFINIGRSIFATLLHVVATGLIAFFVIKKQSKKLADIMKIFVGILAGFGLHSVYNLSLYFENRILTIFVLLISYFILSFLLFKSDLIYKKK